MNEKILDWLNANRFRAFPFVNDERLLLPDGRRVPDCIVLDCLVVDTRQDETVKPMVFKRITVTEDYTDVRFSYGGTEMSCIIEAGDDGDSGIVRKNGRPTGLVSGQVDIRLAFSSHGYILGRVGTGAFEFSGRILPSRVISVRASGVSGIRANGSQGEGPAGTAVGTVELRDGYRTMPTVNGKGQVVVYVGRKYGKDPCHHDWGSEETTDETCGRKLLFFCGQTGDVNGAVVLNGGPGVGLSRGEYRATRDILGADGGIGIATGERVPCVEVIASSELLGIYRPTEDAGSSSTGDSSGDATSSDSPDGE